MVTLQDYSCVFTDGKCDTVKLIFTRLNGRSVLMFTDDSRFFVKVVYIYIYDSRKRIWLCVY